MEVSPTMYDAQSLEGLFVTFVRTLLARAEKLVISGSLWSREYIRFASYPEVNGYIVKVETRPAYQDFLYLEFYNSILLMEEAERCARRLWETGILQVVSKPVLLEDAENPLPPPLSFEQNRSEVIRDLLCPVIEIVTRYNTLQPTNEQILDCYNIFKERWTSPSNRWVMIFPLLNFIFVGNPQQAAQIGKYFRIASFPSEEKNEIWNRDWEIVKTYPLSWPGDPMNRMTFAEIPFKLIGTIYERKHNSLDQYEAQELVVELRNVITALRLFKQGNLGATTWFWRGYPSSFEDLTCPKIPMQSNDYLVRQELSGHQYMLHETDLSTISTIFDSLQKLNPLQQPRKGKQKSQSKAEKLHGELTVALRRFNQAYNRDTPEDQIIDLIIALESSLFDTKDQELKYRFSLRGAALLSKAKVRGWDPYKSQTLLSVMYDVRSAIVHNGKQLVDLGKTFSKLETVAIQPEQFLLQSENIVRDILRSYVLWLANGRSKKSIIEELDRYVMGGMVAQQHPVTEDST